MATKTTKRKRATAQAPEPVAPEPSPAPAPVEAIVATEAAPATGDEPAATPAETISLSSNCTVKDATALKGALLQALDAPEAVAIDAKSVERIDTATVQLLCAFVRDRAARNLSVTWSGAPQPLLDAARLLGVSSLLALPSEVGS